MSLRDILTADLLAVLKDKDNQLLSAVEAKDLKAVRKQIARGADVNKVLRDIPLLHKSILNGTEDISLELINNSKIDIGQKCIWEYTALNHAAHVGQENIAKRLLEKGADINDQNRLECTPLISSIQNKNFNLALYLIEDGADINLLDNNGGSALSKTAIYGQVHIAIKLLEKGADIDSKDTYGNTPLLLSIENNVSTVTEELIERGANINITNDDGRNALMIAIIRKNITLAKKLIDLTDDIEAKDNNGCTALTFTQMDGHRNLQEHILSKISKKADLAKESSEKWEIMGEDKILFTSTYPKQKLELKKIFDLALRERVLLYKNLETGNTAQPETTSFNAIAKTTLTNIFEEFSAQGGQADKNFVVHGSLGITNKPKPKSKPPKA